MTIVPRLHAVIADVFGVREDAVTDDDSPDSIEAWDSATHIQLVFALEAEFGVRFEPQEIADLASVAAIRRRIEREVTDGSG
ncbi:MAG TPA: acyl carrier protein [Gemmatimonadales bacterium]